MIEHTDPYAQAAERIVGDYFSPTMKPAIANILREAFPGYMEILEALKRAYDTSADSDDRELYHIINDALIAAGETPDD